jgi:hypothetical protein
LASGQAREPWGRAADAAAAIEHLRRALAANAALKAPVQMAHTQLDYARALGPGRQARTLIDDAAQAAQELALPAVARRVDELRGA